MWNYAKRFLKISLEDEKNLVLLSAEKLKASSVLLPEEKAGCRTPTELTKNLN